MLLLPVVGELVVRALLNPDSAGGPVQSLGCAMFQSLVARWVEDGVAFVMECCCKVMVGCVGRMSL